jgi:hypothetical protein
LVKRYRYETANCPEQPRNCLGFLQNLTSRHLDDGEG